MTLWILRQLQLLNIFEFGPKIAEVSLKLKGLTNLYYNIFILILTVLEIQMRKPVSKMLSLLLADVIFK